ncbi:MAG: hypothetical protein H0U71_04240 [Gammaproteobacteria bacterium]|nr:hypothetical protein [Gammaproteobacteria bacterium]
MALEDLPDNHTQLEMAIRSGNITQFDLLLKKLTEDDIYFLLTGIHELQNKIFHLFLIPDPNKWYLSQEEEENRVTMCSDFLSLDQIAKSEYFLNSLNTLNSDGLTPLHLAIKLGYTAIVDKLLALGVDISLMVEGGESTLEMAAKYQPALYKKLLKKHTSLQEKNSSVAQGYSCEQLQQANDIYLNQLKKKKISEGFLGSLMTIACPTGAVFAFNNLPLLECFFALLIPAVAVAWVGLALGVVAGGIFLYATYSKSLLKYGAHAQEMVTIDSTNAQIARLTAELKATSDPAQKEALSKKLDALHGRAENITEINQIDSKWATTRDIFVTRAMGGASFVCAFSGFLGILGFFSQFLPAAATTAIVLAGIPIVGWAALGVAVVLGGVVAYWAYKLKFKPLLQQTSDARRDLHTMKFKAHQARCDYEEAKKLSMEQEKTKKTGQGLDTKGMQLRFSKEVTPGQEEDVNLSSDQSNSAVKTPGNPISFEQAYQIMQRKRERVGEENYSGEKENPHKYATR